LIQMMMTATLYLANMMASTRNIIQIKVAALYSTTWCRWLHP
jgi:hypothetical protein